MAARTHYIINTIQKLIQEGANIRFIILGETKEHFINKYKKFLFTIELSERIQFLGKVSHDVVPSYYAISDFMLLLRKQTRKSSAGFPTKFTESFISGVPVIANLTSDIGIYLNDGITGFIIPEPTENAIYKTIKSKVLILSRVQIENLKLI